MIKKFNQQFACSRMMLPEHCGSLRQHAAAIKRAEEQRRPLADEQLQAEQQQLLEAALSRKLKLEFTLLDESGHSSVCGVPYRLDETAGTIYIDTGSVKPFKIKAAAVIVITEGP
jgi:hypothetical protein